MHVQSIQFSATGKPFEGGAAEALIAIPGEPRTRVVAVTGCPDALQALRVANARREARLSMAEDLVRADDKRIGELRRDVARLERDLQASRDLADELSAELGRQAEAAVTAEGSRAWWQGIARDLKEKRDALERKLVEARQGRTMAEASLDALAQTLQKVADERDALRRERDVRPRPGSPSWAYAGI